MSQGQDDRGKSKILDFEELGIFAAVGSETRAMKGGDWARNRAARMRWSLDRHYECGELTDRIAI